MNDLARANLQALKCALEGRSQTELAAKLGMSDATLSRILSDRLEHYAAFIAAVGLQVVPADYRLYKPGVIQALHTLAHEYLEHSTAESIGMMWAPATEQPPVFADAVKAALHQIRRSQFASKRPDLVLQLIDRDGYRCRDCGCEHDLTVDHITPLSKGGSDELQNLQLLCAPCNSSKGDREQSSEAL